MFWLRARLAKERFRCGICFLAAIELLTFSYGYLGFAAPNEVFPPAPVFDFLARQGNPAEFRIAKVGYPIPANSGMFYGVEMAEGYDLPIERTRLFTQGLTENRDDGVFFLADKIVETNDRRLDLMNLKYIVTSWPSPEFDRLVRRSDRFAVVYEEGAIAVFENKSVLPRAFVVPEQGVEVIPDPAAQLNRLKDVSFDPQKAVIVSRSPVEAAGGDEPFSGDVRLSESHNHETVLQTRGSGPSILVLSQTYYSGWQATIDGREASVEPVDFALSGVALPSGTHEVRFVYRPESFRLGALIR
ncbi:MAG TPA: YfhO family protein [Terriglobia bacterium]